MGGRQLWPRALADSGPLAEVRCALYQPAQVSAAVLGFDQKSDVITSRVSLGLGAPSSSAEGHGARRGHLLPHEDGPKGSRRLVRGAWGCGEDGRGDRRGRGLPEDWHPPHLGLGA